MHDHRQNIWRCLRRRLPSPTSWYPAPVENGEAFIRNDRHRGNEHPSDITIAKPMFHGGQIAFWPVSTGHHAASKRPASTSPQIR